MRRRLSLSLALAVFFALFCSTIVMAKSNKSTIVSLPLFNMNRQSVAHFEYNVGSAGLGVEVMFIPENEYFSEREMEKNGDSMMVRGSEISVLYSRYGNSAKMSGGFFTIGLGYRALAATWRKSPSDAYSMDSAYKMDEDGRLEHTIRGAGVTGRVRGGYRYVAESVPFVIGIYGGLRHFQNSFVDVTSDDSVSEGIAPTEQGDLASMSDRFTTGFEPGIEIGFSF